MIAVIGSGQHGVSGFHQNERAGIDEGQHAPARQAGERRIVGGALAGAGVAAVDDAPRGDGRGRHRVRHACLATPYLQDYDLVFGVVVAWLWQQPVETTASERALQIGYALLLVLPLTAAALGQLTGLAFGPLFVLPLFAVAVQMSLRARGGALSASSSRLSSAQP